VTDETRLARVALGLLVEPGNRELGGLVRAAGPVEALRRLREGNADPRLIECSRLRLIDIDPIELADRALERADRLGVRIVTPEDEEWPAQLEDLVGISLDVKDPIERHTYPPQCVWLRGPWRLAEACQRAVAVVGSRASTSYGKHVATELGFGLAERGWTVVSGGAFGIDAAAHRGALAGGGCTIAVLACGIDRPYPASHASLFDRIGEEGLLFSEWPPGADPHRHRFLIRNRVIAALPRGTAMVEAGYRSGARFTLNRAKRLNRACVAFPGPVTSAVSQGCHIEIRNNEAVLAASALEVIDSVGRIGLDLAPPPTPVAASPRDLLTTVQAQVLDGVRPRKILTAEQIAAAVGVSSREARAALPLLESGKFVTAVNGGYRLHRPSDDKPVRLRGAHPASATPPRPQSGA
jgi:DNA processing protein